MAMYLIHYGDDVRQVEVGGSSLVDLMEDEIAEEFQHEPIAHFWPLGCFLTLSSQAKKRHEVAGELRKNNKSWRQVCKPRIKRAGQFF